MATLNLTADEFADIAMIWLFDHVMNPDQIGNEDLQEFLSKHSSKIRTPLMKYYLDSGGDARLRYKRIKGIFDGSDKSIQQIRIGPAEKIKDEEEKQGKIKKAIKKVLRKEELSLEDINLLKEMENVNFEIYDKINEG
jgi:hypothetical protein